ncbi:hypothetical protein BDQ94DRAFT_169479 [Aspergillus welwitschiae]|uniref:Uncharacterized protein n=1 Tax=Aspergillus welwitschiae TaxID=1341132 RepID=A0A3F3Q6K8_9EURO|nr:hypothetical protein BDQ94DRAFT_169479 [Aspergillus welwitschiae]RDH34552.1 hypothetical protein BDQ94DRAFT_169479 [Aspergillus welwitschiae]
MSGEPGKRPKAASRKTSLDSNPPGDQYVEFVNAENEIPSNGAGRLSAGRGAILANAARELQDVAARQSVGHTSNRPQPPHLGTRRSRQYEEPAVPQTWAIGSKGKQHHRQMPAPKMVAPTQSGTGDGYTYSSYKRPPLFTQAPKNKVHRPKSPTDGHSQFLTRTLDMFNSRNEPPAVEIGPNHEIDMPPTQYMAQEPPFSVNDGGISNHGHGGGLAVYEPYNPALHPYPPPDPQGYGSGVPHRGKGTIDFSF